MTREIPSDLFRAAYEQIRNARISPFADSVVPTARQRVTLVGHVPTPAETDLHELISHRVGTTPLTAVPIVGRIGAGKTHLLHWLAAKEHRARTSLVLALDAVSLLQVTESPADFVMELLRQLDAALTATSLPGMEGTRTATWVEWLAEKAARREFVKLFDSSGAASLPSIVGGWFTSRRTAHKRLKKIRDRVASNAQGQDRLLAQLIDAKVRIDDLVGRMKTAEPAGVEDRAKWRLEGHLIAFGMGKAKWRGLLNAAGQEDAEAVGSLSAVKALIRLFDELGVSLVMAIDQAEDLSTESLGAEATRRQADGLARLWKKLDHVFNREIGRLERGALLLVFVHQEVWVYLNDQLDQFLLDRLPSYRLTHSGHTHVLDLNHLHAVTFDLATSLARSRLRAWYEAQVHHGTLPAKAPSLLGDTWMFPFGFESKNARYDVLTPLHKAAVEHRPPNMPLPMREWLRVLDRAWNRLASAGPQQLERTYHALCNSPDGLLREVAASRSGEHAAISGERSDSQQFGTQPTDEVELIETAERVLTSDDADPDPWEPDPEPDVEPEPERDQSTSTNAPERPRVLPESGGTELQEAITSDNGSDAPVFDISPWRNDDDDDDDDAPPCKAKTAAGDPCGNRAYPGNYGYCRVHRKYKPRKKSKRSKRR